MTVNYDTYTKMKAEFIKKHKFDFRVQTSSMDEYDSYHKEYIFEDGAIWYEVIGPEYVREEVTVKLFTKVEVEVKLMRTEFWNSDNAKSFYLYERY